MRSAVIKLEFPLDNKVAKLRAYRAGKVRMGAQEADGAKGILGRRPFVKRVVDATKNGTPVKKNIQGKKSYLEANSDGSRGVYYWWNIPHGWCVQIQEALSRSRSIKYFAIIIDGKVNKITQQEAALYAIGKIKLN